jgi:hypothetical protein
MKKLISDETLYQAFVQAEIGDPECYACWTTLWGVRSRVWNKTALRKQARTSLGELVRTAIEEGNSALLRKFADGLDLIKILERGGDYALKADVFFAVEELNSTRKSFTKNELLSWLNAELDNWLSEDELHRELQVMGLSKVILNSEKAAKKQNTD